ncbi:MAG: hypothetical protein WAX77_06740 [Methylococcaceae bacterium]
MTVLNKVKQSLTSILNIALVAMIKAEDQEFLKTMAQSLDETIKKLAIDEQVLIKKIGLERVEELRDLWQQQLNEQEESDLKHSLDYWDKLLIYTWASSKRAHTNRAQVGQTLMKLASK